MPLDRFNRDINYLRISVTDRCNLRCTYCMPLRDLRFAPREEMLTAAEMETVARAAADVGFSKIRITGGEPTLRSDIVDIVRALAGVPGVRDLAMTTNGMLLPRLIDDLVAAGLHRVNIHVDTLHSRRLKRLMRFGSIDEIWAGVQAVESRGLLPVKLNAVVVRDFNDEDVVQLAALTMERDWHVRFIELMPLGDGPCAQVAVGQFVPTRETKSRIERALGPLTPLPSADGADESVNYRIDGGRGVVGFISPVSDPYCGTCNRMRLTADGKFHLCLLNDDELDVRSVVRNGGGFNAVRDLVLQAVQRKPTGHRLEEGISTRQRNMFQIGG